MDKQVTRNDLDERIKKIVAKVKNPKHGVFGPDSMMWKINREHIVGLGGERALLLQLAHPWVSTGVAQHSKVKTDPLGRAYRTFHHVSGMIFGDLNSALKSARTVHGVHKKVQGVTSDNVHYMANNEDALMWVHATLWETSVLFYELFNDKLTKSELDQYYEETKFFAYLFGISDETLPKTWDEFEIYNHLMWSGYNGQIKVNDEARDLAKYLFVPHKLVRAPSYAYQAFTAALMPDNIRKQYNMKLGLKEKLMFHSMYHSINTVYKMTPAMLRYSFNYREALKRIKSK